MGCHRAQGLQLLQLKGEHLGQRLRVRGGCSDSLLDALSNPQSRWWWASGPAARTTPCSRLSRFPSWCARSNPQSQRWWALRTAARTTLRSRSRHPSTTVSTTLSKPTIEDMYPGYMTEMTRQTHIGVDVGQYYNKMVIEYPSEIKSYSDKIKSYN
jgi:hypothetical protein